jgi:hypothetical protein
MITRYYPGRNLLFVTVQKRGFCAKVGNSQHYLNIRHCEEWFMRQSNPSFIAIDCLAKLNTQTKFGYTAARNDVNIKNGLANP